VTFRSIALVPLAATVLLVLGAVLVQASVAAPPSAAQTTRASPQTPATPRPGAIVKPFPATGTEAQFLATLADPTIDILELAPGTYHFARTVIDVDRTARPLIIRPAAGARVVFAGDAAGGGQFYFGQGGVAAYLDFEFAGVTFDGYAPCDTGLVWLGNANHITFDGPTVRNAATCAGPGPIDSWALYLSVDGGVSPSDVVADDWTVIGADHNFSALQVGHPPSSEAHISARRWNVSGVAYSVYAYGTVTDLILDGWTIANSVVADRPYTLYFGPGVSGTYSNMHATGSGGIESKGAMTDGGGNSLATGGAQTLVAFLILAVAAVVGGTRIGIAVARSRRAARESDGRPPG
jgi:hypothetical protein